MDIHALRKHELFYELKLHGWTSALLENKSTDDLSKLLRGHINAEHGNRSICDLHNV